MVLWYRSGVSIGSLVARGTSVILRLLSLLVSCPCFARPRGLALVIRPFGHGAPVIRQGREAGEGACMSVCLERMSALSMQAGSLMHGLDVCSRTESDVEYVNAFPHVKEAIVDGVMVRALVRDVVLGSGNDWCPVSGVWCLVSDV